MAQKKKAIAKSSVCRTAKKVELDEQYKTQFSEFVNDPIGGKYEKTVSGGNLFMVEKLQSALTSFGQELGKDAQIKKMIYNFVYTLN